MTMKPEIPKFIQIVTGGYTHENGAGTHCIYGLAVDGLVYRYQRTPSPGWIQLDARCKNTERTEQ